MGGSINLLIAIALVAAGAVALLFHRRWYDAEAILSWKMAGVIFLGFGLANFCIFLVETY